MGKDQPTGKKLMVGDYQYSYQRKTSMGINWSGAMVITVHKDPIDSPTSKTEEWMWFEVSFVDFISSHFLQGDKQLKPFVWNIHARQHD